MNSEKYYNIAVFALMLALSGSLYAAPEMVIGLDRTAIYEGESLEYQVILTDTQPINDSVVPDLSGVTDFDVETLPTQRLQSGSSSVRIVINNKEVKNETTNMKHVVAYTYLLTPKRSGSLVLPPPKVLLEGKVLIPDRVEVAQRPVRNLTPDGAVAITVAQPNAQDSVILKIETNRTRQYPLQKLTVSLVVYVKDLPGVDPMSVRAEPPRLVIPWIEDGSLSKGMMPSENREQWLLNLNIRRGRGFAINDYSQRTFFESVLLQFLPEATKVSRPDFSGKETDYLAYRFERTFTPETIGNFSFGPVSLKGSFAVAAPAEPRGIGLESIFSTARAVVVEVVDVPMDNRPSGYLGAFGTFKWSADFQPRSGRVGEPMSLTLRLIGEGSTANVKAPDLTTIPEIVDHFKVYPPTEEVKSGQCTFTYTVRPIHAGTLTIPQITASYFDVETEKFVILQSTPISLEIAEAELVSTARSFGIARRTGDLELSDKGFFANMTGAYDVVNQSVDYVRWGQVIGGLAVFYLFLFMVVAIQKRRGADPVRRRRAGAFSRAKRHLEEIRQQEREAGSSPEQLANALKSTFCGYVADRGNVAEQGMTTKDACEKLLELGATGPMMEDIRRLLEMLDGTRYGGLDLRSFDELLEDTERILQNLSHCLQGR